MTKINNPHLTIDRQIIGDTYTSMEIMDNLLTLCDDFGSRFGGTAGEKQAADFIKSKLEAYGLQNARLEPIEYIGWRRGTARLAITTPIERELPCITLPHSPPANLSGAVIDMGDGAPEDFEERAAEIKGKIVLTTSEIMPANGRRWIHRNEKYGRAILAGAIGFIFVNHYPGCGVVTGGISPASGGAGLIPAFSLSYEDGSFLQRLIKRKGDVALQLTSDDQLEPMVSWNVLAELSGETADSPIVMIGSHYDGHDISQGATDPASGTVAVLEAARTLAQYAPDLPCAIRFAFWGIEEIGLVGSVRYTKKHIDELDKLRFYLNMDSAGAFDDKNITLNKWEELTPLFKRYGKEMALELPIEQSIHAHSDHYPFLMAGVPTGGIDQARQNSSGRGYGHTKYDTVDKVTLRGMREAAVLAARLALRVANEEEWPVVRRTADEVTAVLDNPDNRAEIEIFKRINAFYQQATGA